MMTVPDFLDFIELVETKIGSLDRLVMNSQEEHLKALIIRCQENKKKVLNDLGTLLKIETSPLFCLTVALGSYWLHLNQVFFLNLPTELQDWLLCDAILWFHADHDQRHCIDIYLHDRTSDWQQWSSQKPRSWSPVLHQKLIYEVNAARDRVKGLI